MPFADAGGVRLYYEEAGRGTPVVFVHEFSGDYRSWEAQMRFFSRRYRCVAFNARGYPPSDVPAASKYSYRTAAEDIVAVMKHLGITNAHVVGCSMGSYSALQLGLQFPRRTRSLTLVGAGAGADLALRSDFRKKTLASAQRFEREGLEPALRDYLSAPNRIQLGIKDPRSWAGFLERFAGHSAIGLARTQRGIQLKRPSIYTLGKKLAQLRVPVHVIVGDEDETALNPSLFIKRACPAARLTVVPATGHVVNLEEPDLFNRATQDFLTLVDSGRWRPRDRKSLAAINKR
jgi:pimeloyl-ACP methyl ester carboxylesterase